MGGGTAREVRGLAEATQLAGRTLGQDGAVAPSDHTLPGTAQRRAEEVGGREGQAQPRSGPRLGLGSQDVERGGLGCWIPVPPSQRLFALLSNGFSEHLLPQVLG